MDEPTILIDHPDAVDVDVDDLETVTMTRAEFDARIKRAQGAAWKEARQTFAIKRERAERIEALEKRTERLERIVADLADALIPSTNKEH